MGPGPTAVYNAHVCIELGSLIEQRQEGELLRTKARGK
jgi:hypothetical protein